jgi:hypothetical protein
MLRAQPVQISFSGGASNVQVGDGYVAYERLGDIFLYTIATGSTIQVTTIGTAQQLHSGGAGLAWLQSGNVYHYNISNGLVTSNVSFGNNSQSPRVFDNWVAWIQNGHVRYREIGSPDQQLTSVGNTSRLLMWGTQLAWSSNINELRFADILSPAPVLLTSELSSNIFHLRNGRLTWLETSSAGVDEVFVSSAGGAGTLAFSLPAPGGNRLISELVTDGANFGYLRQSNANSVLASSSGYQSSSGIDTLLEMGGGILVWLNRQNGSVNMANQGVMSTLQVNSSFGGSGSRPRIFGRYIAWVQGGNVFLYEFDPCAIFSISLQQPIHPVCPGSTDGAVEVTLNGGLGPYQVVWDTNNAVNQFVVTVGTKTASNPTFGQGHPQSYYIDGIEAPVLTLTRGVTYEFSVSASGHPYYISTSSSGAGAGMVSQGVSPASATSGTLTFRPDATHPDTLFYQCLFHTFMGGKIHVVNGPVGTNIVGLSGGNITAYATDANQCIASQSFTVPLKPSPSVALTVMDSVSCGVGSSAGIRIVSSEIGVEYRLLDLAGDPVGNFVAGTGAMLSLPVSGAFLSQTGDFEFRIIARRDGCLDTFPGTALIVVVETPNVSSLVTDPLVCVGDSGTVVVQNPNAGASYTLRTVGGLVLSGPIVASSASNVEFVFAAGGLSVGITELRVWASFQSQCEVQLLDPAQVTVAERPMFLSPAADSVVCAGSSVRLLADSPEDMFHLLPDGTIDFLGAVDDITINLTEAGQHVFFQLNAAGCSDSVRVFCNPVPTIQLPSGGTTVCAGSDLLVENGAVTAWFRRSGGGLVSLGNGASMMFNFSIIGQDTIIAGFQNCTETLFLTVVAAPELTLPSTDTSICLGETIALAGTVGDWFVARGGQRTPIASGQTAASYTATSAGIDTLILISASGCEVSRVVEVKSLPVGQISGPDTLRLTSGLNTVSIAWDGLTGADVFGNWSFGTANVETGAGLGPYVLSYTGQPGVWNIAVEVVRNGCIHRDTLRIVVVDDRTSRVGIGELVDLVLYPNPSTQEGFLRMNLQSAATVRLALRNSLGQIVFDLGDVSCSAGTAVVPIALPTGFPGGLYWLWVQSSSESLSIPWVLY